ncbi:Trm2 tRNA methyltransferase [Candida orthopsilosis Co 90-125]|uniref:tRNA (uracil(54)-C(5))-methyltransferase n=1 Tax=Candida orthopsilosis (strain 90-125) TaxID=1136231 RepID=H8X208_CANO9|nr:Trm2 tRNA methyltransferase [Candida orthopsilosis Co 90-125]CCG22729.1 Trm2 tRNA methyltransferase [Candida orthopsilosis Co 90-125]
MAPVAENKKRPITLPPEAEQPQKKVRTHRKRNKTKKYKHKRIDPTSPFGVLEYEIKELCEEYNLTLDEISNDMKGVLNNAAIQESYHRQVEHVSILCFTSNGDSLALVPHIDELKKKQVVVVPFGIPGDEVTIKIFKTHPLFAEADLLSIQSPSKLRDNSIIKCRYFGKCSGCQFQDITYDEQLNIKRQTIVNAFKHFAPQLSELKKLPQVLETQGSPLQYNYRTKLTPHFDIATKKTGADLEHRPNFGFGAKGRPTWRKSDFGPAGSILDIEECNIGTQVVNIGLRNERKRLESTYKTYEKGATILLREDTKVKDGTFELGEASRDEDGQVSSVTKEAENKTLVKTCVTESRQVVQEIINEFKFEFSAGEFFQNNNSILSLVTSYVKSNLLQSKPNYLVDAYCGSGLFSITCSENVSKVIGVEVSADSVKFARHNAQLNKIENAQFIVGKAEEIFKDINTPADQTSVILDPPRKGCDDVFLNQLSAYNPAKVVYISCNVHSQARDIEWFLTNTENGSKYEVESIKGFDFFPQTHHVESVAVLSLR